MALSVGQIGLDLVLNSSGFKRQMNSINATAKNASDKISSSFKKIATTAVAAFSVKKIADFGKQCIDLGSDLSEVQNVVDVTYSSMSNSLNKWAKNATKSFGLSETMAKKYAGLYGSMAESFGFSEKQAYKMSTALTGLAGDVASFYNITQDEAYTKLKSVFSGETETLKDLGIVMTQSALDSYALQKGLNKTTSAMTEAEKVSLRYAFVTDQLANAQGDFTRTSNSWANQTRVLKLNVDSIKASLGQSFIAVLTPAIKTFNTLIEKIKSCTDSFKEFATNAFGANFNDSSTAKVSSAVADTTDNTDNLTESLETANKSAEKLKNNLAGFDKLNVISKQTSTTSNTPTSQPTTSGLSGKVKLDTSDLDKANSKAKKLNALLNKLGFDKVKKSAKYAFGNILDSIKDIGKSWKRVWSNGTGDRVLTHINSLLTTGFGIVGDISGAFKKAWNKAKLGDSVVQAIIDRADSLVDLIDTIGKDFRKVWNGGSGERIWSNILKYIRNSNKAVATFRRKIKEAWQKNETGKKIWKSILGIVEDITEFLSDMSKIKLDWLEDLDLSPILTSAEKLVGAFRNLLKVCGDKLKMAYKNVLLPLAKWTIEEVVPKLLDMFAKALDAISYFAKKINVQHLKSIAVAVGAVGSAILIFQASSAFSIANGVGRVSMALEKLGNAIGAHPALLALSAVIGGIAGLVGVVKSAKDARMSDLGFTQVSKDIEDSITKIRDCKTNIEGLCDDIKDSLKETSVEMGVIEDYKKRLDELLSKATLTPEEQAELTTIGDYFSQKYPAFKKAWDKYIQKNKNGTISINGNVETVKQTLDGLIDKYRQVAAEAALTSLSQGTTENILKSQSELTTSAKAYKDAAKKFAEFKSEWGLNGDKNTTPEEQLKKLKNASAGEVWKNKGYYLSGEDGHRVDTSWKQSKASELLEQYNKLSKQMKTAKSEYLETAKGVASLEQNEKDLSRMKAVVNGDYSDASAVLMAYRSNLISTTDVEKSKWKSLKNLRNVVKQSGQNAVFGYTDGIGDKEIKSVAKKGIEMAGGFIHALNGKDGLDEHSPSKKTKQSAVYAVEGFAEGITNNIKRLRKPIEDMLQAIKSPFLTLKDWFRNVFAGVGATAGDSFKGSFKDVLNTMLSTVEKVINTPISGINKMLEFTNGTSNSTKFQKIKFPKLAKGGLVKAPTLALVGDNKGASTGNPEVVAPLNKLQGMINSSSNPTDTAILSEILSVLKKIYELFLLFRRQGGSSYEFVVELSGSVLFDEIVKQDRIYRKCHGGKSAFS